EKPYVCELCYKGFSQHGNLKKHLLIHSKEKPYVCEICNKGFSETGNLKVHLRTHTNEKPYVCEMCSKGFSQIGCLISHLRIHTKEKPYVCEMCNKGFSQNGQLKFHLRIHTKEKPYVCEICNKGFSDRSYLKRHLRIHTKEKPYVCEICNKGFSERGYLKRHLRIHTKEKPYVCEVCNKGFSEQVKKRMEVVSSPIAPNLRQREDAVQEYLDDMEDAENYRDRYIEMCTRVDLKIRETVVPTETETRSFKLPKIELKKFSGEAKDFLAFWSQFQKIHDKSIVEEDKMQYLLQSVKPKSKAERLVLSFPATAENYPKATDQLKKRLGREDLLVQIYVRELLSLVMKNALFLEERKLICPPCTMNLKGNYGRWRALDEHKKNMEASFPHW
ncbi:zinc finger protein 112, partial [Trichonephila clavipes]